MIIYKTFTGNEYDSKEKYDEAMESLLNKPINEFRYYELNSYLLEFMPIKKILNNGKRDKFWADKFHFNYDNNCCITICFDREYSNNYYLTISYQMEPNFNIHTGFENYNHMLLHVEYPISETLLLKNLIKECEVGIKKTIEYWKNIGLLELTNSLNTNFDKIGGINARTNNI